LDPTRTLDIFLDTFSDQLVEHYQFFLDFLSVSPWAPKSKRKTPVVPHDEKGKQKALPIEVDLEKDEGSDTIAQILGFKFGYYQVSNRQSLSSKCSRRDAYFNFKNWIRPSTRDKFLKTFI
jgi:hypothetical protein